MATLDDLVAALDAADAADTPTISTSVRQPAALRHALQIAVELGVAPTANEATTEALRGMLERFALRRGLDEHYAAHPEVRPALHEVAYGMAVLEDSPLQHHPALLARAQSELLRHVPEATAHDLYLFALGRLEAERASATA